MKRLFKGGTLVSGSQTKKADILTEGEKIIRVEDSISDPEAEIIDVDGKLLFPGFIDAHTHFDLAVSGTVTADGFETGTKAALAGGTTCIVDFATQYNGESLHEALRNWHKKSDGKASCDYGYHLAIADWNDSICEELESVVKEGITSFKIYTIYDEMFVDDETIYKVLKRMKELSVIVGVHCENRGLIDALVKEAKVDVPGEAGVKRFPGTRPDTAEAEAVGRILKLADYVGVPVMIVHLSSRKGYEEIKRARENGQRIFAETCPQYLLLDEGKFSLSPEESRKYVLAPPLRKAWDQEVLWEALKKGEIQTVSTDHCSFTTEQKAMGKEDFSKIPCGMPGVQDRPALMYTYGVREEKITLMQMCALLSENPAKIYGMYPKKGCLQPGSDADIVIWNPETEGSFTAKGQQSRADYHPYEGRKKKGSAEAVYLRGVCAAQNGEVIKEHGGQFVKRGKPDFDLLG